MTGYNTTQNRMAAGRAILSALVLWLAFSGVAAAEQLYVNESGWWQEGGAFNASGTPIQAAVGAAGDGDAIYVHGGNYNENVDVDKPRLTLQGAGADVVTVASADSGNHVFEVTENYVNISGFAVSGATGHLKAGIRLYDVDHCNIYDNSASDNWCGIYLMDSSNSTLQSNAANSNTHYGIYLSSSSNNTLTSNTANSNNYYGIHLWNSNSNTLQDDTANSNNYYGIYLSSSSGNTLSSSTANLNDEGGICLYESSNTVLSSNTANSNRVGIYMEDSSGNTLQSNTANSNDRPGTHLYYSSGNILKNNIASNNYWGVYMEYSGNNTLQSNIASNNYYGLYMRSSGDNILTSNTANSNNYYNIDLSRSNNNTLQSNTASNGKHGIFLSDSSGNILQNNTANSNNWCGIGLGESSDNIITCNWVQNNRQRGFYLRSGSSNNISYNNIVENGVLQGDGSCRWQFELNQYQPVEAKHNYWGAGMNSSTIDASIYDDEEGGLGEVEFCPFETEPVQCPLTPEEPPAFTTADAAIALQIAVGSRPPDSRYDVSGDGSVTSLDALMILQAAAGGIEIG